MSENKYVKKISDVERGRILQNSVAALSAKPTLNATEMKMRFVKPIIDTDKDAPSLAKEIDRVADETDAALQAQEKTMDSIDNNVIAIGSKMLEIESNLGGVQRKVSSIEDEITDINITLTPIPSQVYGVNMRLDSVESDIKYGKVSYITASIDSRNYVLTFTYYGTNNFKIGSTSIDLPLESMVVGAEYNKDTKSLILSLKSGDSILVPLEDIFAGLINESEKGAPNGVTPLDENGKIPKQYLPEDGKDLYRLIETIELAEEVSSIRKDTEADGKKYNFKELLVLITNASGNTGNAYVYASFNGSFRGTLAYILLSSGKCIIKITAKQGLANIECHSGVGDYTQFDSYSDYFSLDAIDTFYVIANGTFKAGTKLTIYGIDA